MVMASQPADSEALSYLGSTGLPAGPSPVLAYDADRPWLKTPDWRPDVNRVLTRVVTDGRGVRALSVPELVYVDAFLELEVPVEAARWAGYLDPAAMGHVLKRRLQSVIEKERKARQQTEVVLPPELLRRLSLWVRAGGDVGSPTSVKAAELLGKATGVLTDKLDVRMDRDSLREQVLEVLNDPQRLAHALKAPTETLEAEFTTSESHADPAA